MRPTAEEKRLHKEKVIDYLNLDRKGPKRFCNKILCSEGNNYPVHDNVVGSISSFFGALFDVEMKEKYAGLIDLENIPSERLGNVIDYIYTGDIEITEENVLDILEDAEYTQLNCLKQYCNLFIIDILTADNCLSLRAYARRYNLSEVENKANEIISGDFATVVQHGDFMKLDVEDMKAILKERKLTGVEHAAFNGVVQWINHNQSSREELFVDLFSQLDLTCMSTEFLTSTIKNEKLVRNHLECSNAVMDSALNRVKSVPSIEFSNFLIIGGENSERDCTKHDMNTRKVKQLQKLNDKRRWPTSALVGRNVFVIGGSNFSALSSCEKLDLEKNDKWTIQPHMSVPRNFPASTVVGDNIYVSGGVNNSGKLSMCEVFGIKRNMWQEVGNMIHKRMGHGMCSIGSGSDGDGKSCEQTDVRTEKWSLMPKLNEGRSQVVCIEFDEKIYAIGGWGKSTVECYCPVAAKWRKVKSMKTVRCNAGACVLGKNIYVVGGSKDLFGSQPLSCVEVYDPTLDSWTSSFDLDVPICGHTVLSV